MRRARLAVRLAAISALALQGACASKPDAEAVFNPDNAKVISANDSVRVDVVSMPGLNLGSIDQNRLAEVMRRQIDLGKQRRPSSSSPPRHYHLEVSINHYDPGSAGGAEEQTDDGGTHIDGALILTDTEIIAFGHHYRDAVADKQSFAWSKTYPGPTDIQAVETEFARDIATKVLSRDPRTSIVHR